MDGISRRERHRLAVSRWTLAPGLRSVFSGIGILLGLGFLAGGTLVFGDEDEAPSLRELKSQVKEAVQSQDEVRVKQVLDQLARMPGREPTQAILAIALAMPPNEGNFYWRLLDGVTGSHRPLAMTELGEFIVRNRKHPISRDLLHSLSRNHSKYVNRVIRRVLDGGTNELRLMAIDMSVRIISRRTVDVLLDYFEREEKRLPDTLKRRLVLALQGLTHQQYGPFADIWRQWWESARVRGLKIVREESEGTESNTAVALDPIRAREFLAIEQIPPGRVLVIQGPTLPSGDMNFDHIEKVLERIKVKHDVVVKHRLEEKRFSLDRYAAIFMNCTRTNSVCGAAGHNRGAAGGGGRVEGRRGRCPIPTPPGQDPKRFHETYNGKLNEDAVEKLRRFVKRGGYLFSEDWVIRDVLVEAFPSYLSEGAVIRSTEGVNYMGAVPGFAVSIRPARGMASHPFLRGVFAPPPDLNAWGPWEEVDEDESTDGEKYDPRVEDDPGDADESGRTQVAPSEEEEEFEVTDPIEHEWVIDDESRAISVSSRKVQVLIESNALKRNVGDASVAITFPYGKGRVLHVLSHFGKQTSASNEATLDNLLVNFLLELSVKLVGN